MHCLNPATITSVLFALSVPTLTFTPLKQLPPPSYTPSLTTLYYGLPKYQINRLHHIQNALARTVVQAPKFQHITPLLKSFHWLKVSQGIEYKIISLTYKIFNTTLWPRICSDSSWSQHALFTLRHSDQTTSYSSQRHFLQTCFASYLEPASYIHRSEFVIRIIHLPLSDFHLNMPVLLATHCYHLPSIFTVSFWA